MQFDHPEARTAFARGAKAAFESVTFYIPTRERNALMAWLEQLDQWQSGDPPAPPDPWKALLP
jgi:hypothetical protein